MRWDTSNASWCRRVHESDLHPAREHRRNHHHSGSTAAEIQSGQFREYPVINVYAQGISLNTIDYFGLGNSTSRAGESVFGMRETIAGANAIVPVIPKLKSLFSVR